MGWAASRMLAKIKTGGSRREGREGEESFWRKVLKLKGNKAKRRKSVK